MSSAATTNEATGHDELSAIHCEYEASHVRVCRQCQTANKARIFSFIADIEELYELGGTRCSATVRPPAMRRAA